MKPTKSKIKKKFVFLNLDRNLANSTKSNSGNQRIERALKECTRGSQSFMIILFSDRGFLVIFDFLIKIIQILFFLFISILQKYKFK